MYKFVIRLLVIVVFYSSLQSVFAQPVKIKDAGELKIALEKLNVLGGVLYIAAHPDDENTGLMAFLSKGKKYRTGYLALTRGDGGQNLIGPEKGSEIGMIRTQELLQARSIDGAEQYFTRAVDFGYSKSPEETFKIWGREEVLQDIVWVIRNFRPDVIITRFPVGSSGGHGHHTASALLAEEAFRDVADPSKFPEQLKYVDVWKTKRIFWNNWRPSPEEARGLISADVGSYNPLLAKSYTEIAALSRSMHKSQGFGSTGSRGQREEYFKFVDGDPASGGLFDGVDITWKRIAGGAELNDKINFAIKNFDSENPSASIPALLEILDSMNKLQSNYWVNLKKQELLDIIRSCAGLWTEAIADDYSAAPGDEIKIKTNLVNRSDVKFNIAGISFPTVGKDTLLNVGLENNMPFTVESRIRLPENYPLSQPYWLNGQESQGLFHVDDMKMVGLAENPPSVPVKINLECEGRKLEYTLPLLYRWNDRVDGERYRPFEIRPPVTANVINKVEIFPDAGAKEIQIKLKSNSPAVNGNLILNAGDGWKITPEKIPFSLAGKYDEKIVTVKIIPPAAQTESNLKIEMEIGGKIYNKALVEISHSHIKQLVYFPESKVKLVKLDLVKTAAKIGYIEGSGDEIPDCLRNMGYDVAMITDQMLEDNNFAQYDAVITGVRAYNTRERLRYAQTKLMEYVKNGGTLIVQYNVASGLQTENLGPYPFKLSQDRITDEDAEIKFADPNSQLLNFPNKITGKDFAGWVQERGLYFSNQWDNRYQTVIGGHDPGENDLYGGMLFTHYGKGIYMFTAYSWFRQLPAGVPGAYRIFANMISAGKNDELHTN